jgi:hypothetical protein
VPSHSARTTFIDEIRTGSLNRGDEFHERIHSAADRAFARAALNCAVLDIGP